MLVMFLIVFVLMEFCGDNFMDINYVMERKDAHDVTVWELKEMVDYLLEMIKRNGIDKLLFKKDDYTV